MQWNEIKQRKEKEKEKNIRNETNKRINNTYKRTDLSEQNMDKMSERQAASPECEDELK
ncbi:hypothetical protein FACS189472_08930 [Alphaproteobacteria bacterium]|nr:hypothetical protein FACS189472_08930 [Alphaproteobacteria bacterium]